VTPNHVDPKPSIKEFYQEEDFVEFLKSVNLFVSGQQELQNVEKQSNLYYNLKALKSQFDQFKQYKY
jgi:hypothetical protein